MATYSGGEALVNVFTTTSNYTVPAGRYAKITMQAGQIGASSSISIGSTSWSAGGGGGTNLYPPLAGSETTIAAPEFILTSGESAALTGSSSFTLTVREFNNP